MKTGGVILAAGLSSRMGAFKPLLKINGFPMIVMTVQSLLNAGAEHIVVVTGFHGDQVREALKSYPVCFAENPDYAVTDMTHSLKIGLRCFENEAVFILPGDIPLIEPAQMGCVMNAAKLAGARMEKDPAERVDYLMPAWEGRRAHPPLLMPSGVEIALNYTGEMGLKGAMRTMCGQEVPVEQICRQTDADHWKEYEALTVQGKAQKGLAPEVCRELLGEILQQQSAAPQENGMRQQAPYLPTRTILQRAEAAADRVGAYITGQNRRGACLDLERCRSAAFFYTVENEISRDMKMLCLGSYCGGADCTEAVLRREGYLAAAELLCRLRETEHESALEIINRKFPDIPGLTEQQILREAAAVRESLNHMHTNQN